MNRNLAIFTAFLVSLALVTGWCALQWAQPSYLFLIISVLAVATWVVYFFIQKTKPEDFIKNYLLTIVLKLLAGGIFISVLLFADQSSAEANAMLFMAAYLLFTGLEVGFLFSRMK